MLAEPPLPPMGDLSIAARLDVSSETEERGAKIHTIPKIPAPEPSTDPVAQAVIEHYSTYGPPGETPRCRTLPNQWHIQPFSKPVTTPWNVPLAESQLPVLLLGFLPRIPMEQSEDTPSAAAPLPCPVSQPGAAGTPGLYVSTDDFRARLLSPMGTLLPKQHTGHSVSSASTSGPENQGRERSATPDSAPPPDFAPRDGSISEDKWFIYADGPMAGGVVRIHMHRSWTGIKLIELVIKAGDRNRSFHPSPGAATHAEDGSEGTDDVAEEDQLSRITHIIWESDPDLMLRNGSAEVYKKVAREVCWWVMGVQLRVNDDAKEADLGGNGELSQQYAEQG